MKTKHFLITSHEGENIAVVSAKTNEQFLAKLEMSLRDYFGDIYLRLNCSSTGIMYTNDKVPFSYSFGVQNLDAWAQRIELY